LGHSFAHAIESSTQYQLFTHGEAVSLGLQAALSLSKKLGMLDSWVLERTTALLEYFALPLCATLPEEEFLLEAMRYDKKVQGGKLRLVLLKALGEPLLYELEDQGLLFDIWRELKTPRP
jgi:3-dehydroquinate synthase